MNLDTDTVWLIHYQKHKEFLIKKTQELLMTSLELFILINRMMDAK